MLSWKVPVILVRLKWNMNFRDRLSKKFQVSKLMEIHPVRGDLFRAGGRADGRTDTRELIVTFRNIANAPKKQFRRCFRHIRDRFRDDFAFRVLTFDRNFVPYVLLRMAFFNGRVKLWVISSWQLLRLCRIIITLNLNKYTDGVMLSGQTMDTPILWTVLPQHSF
jgi:hypothetical protein